MSKWLGGVGVLLGLAASAYAADVATLMKQLGDPDVDARRAAARALGEAGSDAKPAVRALMLALKDRDTFVRRFSAQALGQIGPDAWQAVPTLLAAMNDPRQEVQEAAVTALGKIGSSGVTALASVVRDPNRDPEVRRKAAGALGQLGPAARPALPTLLEILRGPRRGPMMRRPDSSDVRVDVAIALGDIAKASDRETISVLESMTDRKKQRDPTLRQSAQAALQKIRNRP